MLVFSFLSLIVIGVALIVPRSRSAIVDRLDAWRGATRQRLGRWEARDIQRAALRTITRRAMVSTTGAYVWDQITLTLAEEDFARVAPFLREFSADIERLVSQLVERGAGGDGVRYRLLASPTVAVASNPVLLPGTQRVTGRVTGPARKPTGPVAPRTTPTVVRTSGKQTRAEVVSERRVPQLFLGDHTTAVKDELTIGRDHICGIHVDDDRVSRRHALLRVDHDGTVSIIDLGSANGTRINGKTIGRGPCSLANGDLISFGGAVTGRFAYDEPTRLAS